MTATVAFSHVGIHVRDLARMERFYSGFMELTVTDRGTLDTWLGRLPYVFLSADPREHHQIVLAGGRPENLAFNVINQISFRVESFARLRDMHRRMPNEEISDIHPVTHGNALSVYFRDPEGNRIELFIDTPWYVDQPIVIPTDFSLPDDELWQWIENKASKLSGFQPVEEWRATIAERMRRR